MSSRKNAVRWVRRAQRGTTMLISVGAAVVDRMLKRRRNGSPQRSASPNHAFPVIADPHLNPVVTPRPVQVICKETLPDALHNHK